MDLEPAVRPVKGRQCEDALAKDGITANPAKYMQDCYWLLKNLIYTYFQHLSAALHLL